MFLRQQPDGMYRHHFGQLVAQKLRLLVVRQDLQRQAGQAVFLRGADGQRLDVEPLAGKQPGDLGEHAGLVIHQDGKGA